MELALLQLLQDLSNVGLPFAFLFLTWYFLDRRFWPWFTGPYQVQKQRRFEFDRNTETERQRAMGEITRTFAETIDNLQTRTGEKTATQHAEILTAVQKMHVDTTKAISQTGAALARQTNDQSQKLDRWMESVAMMLEILGRIQSGNPLKPAETGDGDDR